MKSVIINMYHTTSNDLGRKPFKTLWENKEMVEFVFHTVENFVENEKILITSIIFLFP